MYSDLQIPVAIAVTGIATSNRSRVLLRGVTCNGTESSITDCQYEYLGVGTSTDIHYHARVLCGAGR